MVFGFVECAAIAVYIVFVFSKYFPRREKKDYTQKYMQIQYWMWRLLRLIMGALLVVSIYYFTLNSVADSWTLILGYAMFITFVVLKDLYCANKHKMKQVGMHFVCWIVLLLVAGVFLMTMLIDRQGLWAVNVGCFSAYLFLFIVKLIVWLYIDQTKKSKKSDGYESANSQIQNIRQSLLGK